MVIVDEAPGIGLGKEKEKWKPIKAFSVDTLTCGGSSRRSQRPYKGVY